MSAREAFQQALAAGLTLTATGDHFRITAAQKPPDAVLEALREHKAAVNVLLRALEQEHSAFAPMSEAGYIDSPLPTHPLSAAQEAEIRGFAARINESDPACITEVIERCRVDLSARAYFLRRAAEPVTCATCQRFTADRIGSGAGIGECRAGATLEPGDPPLFAYARRRCAAWRKA